MDKKNYVGVIVSIVTIIIVAVSIFFFNQSTIDNAGDSIGNSNLETTKLDVQIRLLSEAVNSNPKEVKNYISLSQAYLQKIRETADISYYQKIDDLMDSAKKIDPSNSEIYSTLGSVEIGRHHFREGKTYAQEAIKLNPNNHLYYGLLGDAEIELGEYKEAVQAFQKMVDMRPDYASYIRIAYVRELYGDIKGAKEFLQLSIDSGSSFKENISFAYTELGKLNMREDLNKAKENFNTALQIIPDYPPALEGLGKIAYFENDYTKSEDYFKKAYTKLSIVTYATDLADLQYLQKDTIKAKQYLTLAQLAFDKSSSSGVNTDLEESLFLSDHDLNISDAVAKAERAYAQRPSIYAADYLSWALYKDSQFQKAATYKKEAFKLGENDPVILFHQGMIAYKNGNLDDAKRYLAKALKINPHFSMEQSNIASSTLNSIK